MRVYGVERRKKKKREEGCKVVVKRVDGNDLKYESQQKGNLVLRYSIRTIDSENGPNPNG